ncbi:MAG: DUF3299 domain-containing protein [Pirellulaceae bacterium]|nr:DUF3299 domain-containing protein [Pirellulaceae bacterium]
MSEHTRLLIRQTIVLLACFAAHGWIDQTLSADVPPAAQAISPPAEGSRDTQSADAPVSSRSQAEDRSSRATARAKGDLTFDDLKFEMEKGGEFQRSMLTEEIEKLHKKDIRIRGYILPASVFKLTGITEFVLVRDNMECCFGPGAALYDCIIVHMAKGKTADFSTRPASVRGRFEIKEFKYPESETHYAIYYLVATEVK